MVDERATQPVDLGAIVLSLLLTEYAPYGDEKGFPVTRESLFVQDLGIVGDDFYELIEDIENELGVRFPESMFSKLVTLVPTEAEEFSFWKRKSRRDLSVRGLASEIQQGLIDLRETRLTPKPQTHPHRTARRV